MDIIRPTGVNFRPYGGRMAVDWGTCTYVTDRLLDNYKSIVEPYVKSVVEPMFNTVEHVGTLPPGQKPVTYVINGNQDDWVITEHRIKEETKAEGTWAEFDKDRRAGNIVLKPMRKCRVFGTATPKIISSRPPVDTSLTLKYTDIGGSYPGFCRSSWVAFPAIECDSAASVVWIDRKRFYDVTTVPIPQFELERLMRLVLNELDSVQPNSNLVTQVVSEANSASWDIATEVAELPQTIGYILNGIKQGILLLLRAKRDIRQQLSKGVKTDVASIWMQYRYAIMPIVYGVNDALDVLGMDAVQFQSFRGRKDATLFEGLDKVGGYTIKGAPTYNNRVFLKYKYDVDSSIHQGLQINLVATAWELLPLSFVFDWFFQVGDYLTAAFQPGVVTQHGCQQSVRCKGSLILEGYSSETIKIDVDYYRSRIINPDAFIGINSDVFISFKRAMDALALSWLLFGKTNRRG